jgi:cyanate permease
VADLAPTTPATPSPEARRPRVFFGWWIVGGAIIAQFVAVGLQGQVAGVFLDPMTDELGWSRAEYTSAASLGTVLMGVLAFFVGSVVDQRGARALMVLGATVLGATLLAHSRIEELWQYLLLRGVLFAVGNVLIGNLVVNVTISKWFVERRGWAISIASLGVSASSIVVAPVMTRVVDTIGWRDGWVVLGLATWALVYPVSLVMRRQPEDHGRLPDGRLEADAATERGRAALEAAERDYSNSLTRSQAVRTSAMWLLVLAFGVAGLGLISLFFHFIPFLTDAGYTRTQASLLVSTQGVAALLSKFAWGWAMQRLFPRGLAAVSFVISGVTAAGFVAVAQTGELLPMYALFFVWGLGIGGMIPLQELIWASYFGRRHLGAVRGVGMPLTVIFNAAGPYFAGAYFDRLGSYDGAILTFAALWFIAALLVLAARRPTLEAASPPLEAPPAPVPTPAAVTPLVVEAPAGEPPPAAPALDVPPVTPALGEEAPVVARFGSAPAPPEPTEPFSDETDVPPVAEPESAAPEAGPPRTPPRSYMGPQGKPAPEPATVSRAAPPVERPETPPDAELETWRLNPPLPEEPPADFALDFEAPPPGEPDRLDEWPAPSEPAAVETRPPEARALRRPPRRDLMRYRQDEVISAVAIGVAASVTTTAALWLIARWMRHRRGTGS